MDEREQTSTTTTTTTTEPEGPREGVDDQDNVEDDELINIQTDTEQSEVTDTSTDVALLELDSASEASPPVVSLDDPPPMPDSEVESSSPSRHHSRSRSRSSRRRYNRLRQPRWRNRFQLKKRESNFIAAACSMVVLVLMCTAMAEPQWIYLRGGGCKQNIQSTPVHFLGINQFFYMGQYVHISDEHDGSYTYYKYGPNPEEGLIDCVTPQSLQVIRSIIALCSIGVVITIFAFLLDLHGPSLCVLKTMQRHAILSMCTVGICVAICGFLYWTTKLIKALQIKTKPLVGSRVEVEFSIGFYLIAAAGGMAVIASGCNLLRRPSSLQEEEDRERLMHDMESSGGGYPPDFYTDSMGFVMPPPPPPYQP